MGLELACIFFRTRWLLVYWTVKRNLCFYEEHTLYAWKLFHPFKHVVSVTYSVVTQSVYSEIFFLVMYLLF